MRITTFLLIGALSGASQASNIEGADEWVKSCKDANKTFRRIGDMAKQGAVSISQLMAVGNLLDYVKEQCEGRPKNIHDSTVIIKHLNRQVADVMRKVK